MDLGIFNLVEIIMLDKNTTLNQSGSNNLQVGGDYYASVADDDITEPEFRSLIRRFLVANQVEQTGDFSIIDYTRKNELNGVSEASFLHIKSNSVVGYDVLDSMLKNPLNTNLTDEYEGLVYSLQSKYLHSNLCGRIERFFSKLIAEFSKDCTSVKERNWGTRLMYFMYLRCDLGKK